MGLEFDDGDRREVERIVARYPKKSAALLPVLHLAQDKFGCLSIEVQAMVADLLEVPPTRVREVVTFYEMFHEHPEGQFHLELCTNISCHLLGADRLMSHLKQRLGVEIGHQTENGRFSLMEVECLASCGSGPTMKVGMDYYEGLTEPAVDALLERFNELAPSLEGRPYRCAKEGPHVGPVRGFRPPVPAALPAAPAAPPEGQTAGAEAGQSPADKPEPDPVVSPSASEAPASQAPASQAPASKAPAEPVAEASASEPKSDPAAVAKAPANPPAGGPPNPPPSDGADGAAAASDASGKSKSTSVELPSFEPPPLKRDAGTPEK